MGAVNLRQGGSEVKSAYFFHAMVLLLLSIGCATAPDQTDIYTTAQVNTEVQSDSIEGLDPESSTSYPMLYYIGPGVRRLNHELY